MQNLEADDSTSKNHNRNKRYKCPMDGQWVELINFFGSEISFHNLST